MLFQNPKRDNKVNFIFSEESDEILIICSSSKVVKFDNGFFSKLVLNSIVLFDLHWKIFYKTTFKSYQMIRICCYRTNW